LSSKREAIVKAFDAEICAAVLSGRLAEPFNAAMVKSACPGWADRIYNVFLPKHAVGNGQTTELFVRVGSGLFRLVATNHHAATSLSLFPQPLSVLGC
jgi:hypothetical protein